MRSGLSLSLVILRGKLRSLSAWVDDFTPPTVETGVVLLADLRAGRVREICEQGGTHWAVHSAALRDRIAKLAGEWAKATPAERKRQVGELLDLVEKWLVEVER